MMALWEDLKNLFNLSIALFRPSTYARTAPVPSPQDAENAAAAQAAAAAEHAAVIDRWSAVAVELHNNGSLEQLEADLLAAHPEENEFSMRWKLIVLFEQLAEEFDGNGDRPAAAHCAGRALALYEDDRIDESNGAGGASARARLRDAEARLRRFLSA